MGKVHQFQGARYRYMFRLMTGFTVCLLVLQVEANWHDEPAMYCGLKAVSMESSEHGTVKSWNVTQP
jgi:hypothetical protein